MTQPNDWVWVLGCVKGIVDWHQVMYRSLIHPDRWMICDTEEKPPRDWREGDLVDKADAS